MTCRSTDPDVPAHPESIAKKQLEGIATTVDVGMKLYARYVVLNNLSVEQQAPVKNAHDHYRSSMSAAETIIKELRKKPIPGGYERATQIVQVTSSELLKLIYEFTE